MWSYASLLLFHALGFTFTLHHHSSCSCRRTPSPFFMLQVSLSPLRFCFSIFTPARGVVCILLLFYTSGFTSPSPAGRQYCSYRCTRSSPLSRFRFHFRPPPAGPRHCSYRRVHSSPLSRFRFPFHPSPRLFINPARALHHLPPFSYFGFHFSFALL